ncbi:Yip1 family protein [Rhodovulum strictum]|uniref:YIP1 family protein n=1 Tax=Rhodovulum strictum TaxID=58314 RepID=A0A844B218_9RHOB|nr:Yip1 family protein [Rhodovulum strictum]MRH20161.1 YIP1 family protein [Rhodovulum strictum]
MSDSTPSLLALARDTVSDPREGARRILALDLPEGVLWQALVAVVAVSVLLTRLGDLLVPTPADPLVPIFGENPLLIAVVQGGLLVVTVYAVYAIGRAFGGFGSFAGALAITVWLQVIMVLLQVVQTVFLLILPPLAGLVGLVGIGLFFYLLSNFVTVLHGFSSAMKTFFMILASMMGIVVGMSILLSIFGITFGGALSDV